MKIEIHQEVFEKNKGAMRLFSGKRGWGLFSKKSKGPVKGGEDFFHLNERSRRVILRQFFLSDDRSLTERTKYTGTLDTYLLQRKRAVLTVEHKRIFTYENSPCSRPSICFENVSVIKNILFAPSPFLNLNILPPFF